jgi:hypothetical protein
MGRLFNIKNGDNLQIYKYDGQNHLVKTEYWNAGKLSSYIDQSYDNQKAPAETSPQLFFKGWPREKTLMGEYGNASNNITSVKISTVKATGITEDVSYFLRYQFNSRGIPVESDTFPEIIRAGLLLVNITTITSTATDLGADDGGGVQLQTPPSSGIAGTGIK